MDLFEGVDILSQILFFIPYFFSKKNNFCIEFSLLFGFYCILPRISLESGGI